MRLRTVALPVLAALAFVACSPARAEGPTPPDPPKIAAPAIPRNPEREPRFPVLTPLPVPPSEHAARAVAQRFTDAAHFADAVKYAQAYHASVVVPAAGASQAGTSGPVTPAADGGSCYGGPVSDGIVDRESGGDPTVFYGGGHSDTPFGSGGRAWGCFQTMPFHWAPGGTCGDITDYSIAGQKECASRLPASAWY